MAKKPGKFIASIGPYNFYRTPDGRIVDENGAPAPKKVLDVLKAEEAATELPAEEPAPAVEEEKIEASVEDGKAQRKKRSFGRKLGSATLQTFFPEMYKTMDKFRQAYQQDRDKDAAEQKRNQAQLRFSIENIEDINKNNNTLIKEQLAELEKSNVLLSKIAEKMGVDVGGIPGIGSVGKLLGKGLRGASRLLRNPYVAGGILATGAAITAYNYFKGDEETKPETTPTPTPTPPEGAVGGAPDATPSAGGGGATGGKAESAAVTAAKSKKTNKAQNILNFKASDINFNSQRLTFDVNKLTIDVKSLPVATQGQAASGGGAGMQGTQQAQQTSAPSVASETNTTGTLSQAFGGMQGGGAAITGGGAAAGGYGGGGLKDTGSAQDAVSFFVSKGWTQEQAAGIVANLHAESKFKADAVGDGGKAYGIAQWHPDRQRKFQEIYGKPIQQANFKEQLEFVDWELNNTEKKAGNRLRSAQTAEQAAQIVDAHYERSAAGAAGNSYGRMAVASQIQNLKPAETTTNITGTMDQAFGGMQGGGPPLLPAGTTAQASAGAGRGFITEKAGERAAAMAAANQEIDPEIANAIAAGGGDASILQQYQEVKNAPGKAFEEYTPWYKTYGDMLSGGTPEQKAELLKKTQELENSTLMTAPEAIAMGDIKPRQPAAQLMASSSMANTMMSINAFGNYPAPEPAPPPAPTRPRLAPRQQERHIDRVNAMPRGANDDHIERAFAILGLVALNMISHKGRNRHMSRW